MTAEELEETMRKLREFVVGHGMQWVLDEVDEAIALGVPETRTLRQTSQQGLIKCHRSPGIGNEILAPAGSGPD